MAPTRTRRRRPVRVRHGEPSFINLLDALNGWQLVHQAAQVLGRPAAASFKHVSPAGAAVAGPVDEVTAELYGTAGRDFAAVSHPVDAELCEVLAGLVCDGVVAPGYAPGTAGKLSRKKKGRFLVLEADPGFVPPAREDREVFGLHLTQDRDHTPLSAALLDHTVTGGALPASAREDLLLGLAGLRFTPSNSVCYLRDGRTLVAGAKVDTWWLRRHPVVRALAFRPGMTRQDRINAQLRFIEGDLTPDENTRLARDLTAPAGELTAGERSRWRDRLDGVAFASDGALPFRDNVDHARRHGVRYIAEPGGSIRSGEVEAACREHRITLAHTGLRLFHHCPRLPRRRRHPAAATPAGARPTPPTRPGPSPV